VVDAIKPEERVVHREEVFGTLKPHFAIVICMGWLGREEGGYESWQYGVALGSPQDTAGSIDAYQQSGRPIGQTRSGYPDITSLHFANKQHRPRI